MVAAAKLIGAGLATIGLAGTGVGIGTVTSVRKMHTVITKSTTKILSSDTQAVSPFAVEMLSGKIRR